MSTCTRVPSVARPRWLALTFQSGLHKSYVLLVARVRAARSHAHELTSKPLHHTCKQAGTHSCPNSSPSSGKILLMRDARKPCVPSA